jgi:hypothetical protein
MNNDDRRMLYISISRIIVYLYDDTLGAGRERRFMSRHLQAGPDREVHLGLDLERRKGWEIGMEGS